MAVSDKIDIGALIAESVDGYYKKTIGLSEWYRGYRALTRKVIADYHYMVETDQPQERGHRADINRKGNSAYRKGYKTGWKRHRDNPGDTTAPSPEGLDGESLVSYNAGFADGMGGSAHASNFLQKYNSGDLQGAASYGMENIVGKHLPEVWEKQAQIAKKSQPDADAYGGGMARWMGMDEPSSTGLGYDEEPQLPKQVHTLHKLLSDDPSHEGINHPENLDDNAVHEIGGRKVDGAGNVRVHGVHPADFGDLLAKKVAGEGKAYSGGFVDAIAGAKLTGAGSSQDLRSNLTPEEKSAQSAQDAMNAANPEPGNDPAPEPVTAPAGASNQSAESPRRAAAAARIAARRAAAGDAPQGAAPQGAAPQGAVSIDGDKVDIAKAMAENPVAQRKHQEFSDKLERAAYGDAAVDAHNAGTSHPGLASLREQNFGPHQALDAQRHAHDYWHAQLEPALRRAQSLGKADLAKRSFPQVAPMLDENGQPHSDGRLGLVGKDGQIHDPGEYNYSDKNPQHLEDLVHNSYDPVDVLMHALTHDPRGVFSEGADLPAGYKTAEAVYGQDAIDQHKGDAVPGLFTKKELNAHVRGKKKAKKLNQQNPAMLAKLGVNPAIDAYQAERTEQGKVHEHHNPAIARHLADQASYGGKGWVVKSLSSFPGYEHFTTRMADDGEGATNEVHPFKNSISNVLNRSKKAFHKITGKDGQLLGGTEKPGGGISPNHPMFGFNRGLREADAQLAGGLKRDNLLSHAKLTVAGSKRGQETAADNPNLVRGDGEGPRYSKRGPYSTADQVAKKLDQAVKETIEFMLDVVQEWIQENVQVPEGNMGIVMEAIYSKITPTYGHLFEDDGR